MIRRIIVSALFLLILQSCLTYYEKGLVFHQEFAKGDYAKAEEHLDKNKYIQKDRNIVLYYLDKGVVTQLSGDHERSNEYFEQAYIYFEDFDKKYGQEALALLTNDMMRQYGGEDFEKIYIHYYKAINYIKLHQLDEAMVECRRINIRLDEINDKYKDKEKDKDNEKAKFQHDAFAHVLMGLLYEASGDENNAFIAYRNGYEIYRDDYSKFFNTSVPDQLKKDLVRLASRNGFYEDQERYEKDFNIKFDRNEKKAKRELILFWHNGLGPIKDEWSITFTLIKGSGGSVIFINKELGLRFVYYTRSNDEYNRLNDVRVVRVAFPKYSVRKNNLTGAKARYKDVDYELQLLEDVNKIALKSLKDRMNREMAKALLRLALKQAAEQAARNENEGLGAAVSIFNAATEKADTRNWQTLPAKINYVRIPFDADTNIVDFTAYNGDVIVKKFHAPIYFKKDGIKFMFHQTIPLESIITQTRK